VIRELFQPIPHLCGKTIELRALTRSDADALDALRNDPEVYRYLPTVSL